MLLNSGAAFFKALKTLEVPLVKFNNRRIRKENNALNTNIFEVISTFVIFKMNEIQNEMTEMKSTLFQLDLK